MTCWPLQDKLMSEIHVQSGHALPDKLRSVSFLKRSSLTTIGSSESRYLRTKTDDGRRSEPGGQPVTHQTFRDLGIPFALFDAPTSEAKEYRGIGRCSLCQTEGVHCFEL